MQVGMMDTFPTVPQLQLQPLLAQVISLLLHLKSFDLSMIDLDISNLRCPGQCCFMVTCYKKLS